MTDDVTVDVTVKRTKRLQLPTLPNFILTESGESVPLENFTQDQLREVGAAWTEALIRLARIRNEEATRRLNRHLREQTP